MVDASMTFRSREAVASSRAVLAQAGLEIGIDSPADPRGYALACRNLTSAPPQGQAWISAWLETGAEDGLIAVVKRDGAPVYALALDVEKSGPFRVARLMSGRHANGNFPAGDPAFLRSGHFAMAPIAHAIRAVRPDIDVLALERLLPEYEGIPNPLANLPHVKSPNVALAVNLEGGFDALLSRSSGKRKRKKHRSQTRKFEAAGGFSRIEATTPAETARLLDAFFAMKKHRLERIGIADVFDDAHVREFFHALFAEALSHTPPPFVLHGLEVGGKLRAVTGSSRTATRIICEFGTIADDDLAHASPGDFLFFENIAEACRQGMGVFDFSVGDEGYKRLWCDMETRHFDVFIPLSAKGRLLAWQMRQAARLKASVKNSPLMWRLAKLVRRTKATQSQTPED